MTDLAARKESARQTIQKFTNDLRTASLDIHGHPELAFEEVHAHQVLTELLARHNFSVEGGVCEMPTAFKARWGSGSPSVAIMCEYDALPEVGHACGHNLIAVSGVAAALGVQAALEPGQGTLVVLGSPAEEGGGGKVLLLERGAFEGIDAAMMLHPGPVDAPWPTMLATQPIDVEYHGRGAHASARPFDGLNALDALVLAYTNISVLRQQFRPGQQVHGIFLQAGVKRNIIPRYSSASYGMRARDGGDLEDLKQRVLRCFEAAATASGCRLEYQWGSRPYGNVATNDTLGESFVNNARMLGWALPLRTEAEVQEGGSTDMGNVSHVVPSIHPIYAIPAAAANHTAEFTAASATSEAHERTLRAATALAMTALDFCLQPGMVERVQETFRATQTATELA